MAIKKTRQRLIERLDNYYKLEGFNALFFTGLMIYFSITYPIKHMIFLLYGLFIMTVILVQGTHYWRLKLFVLQKKEVNHDLELSRFASFKKWNEFLIALIPFFAILQWYISGNQLSSQNLIFWAFAANIFAILEHINYFYVQLMYDNPYDWRYLRRNKKLKTASLFKDMRDGSL